MFAVYKYILVLVLLSMKEEIFKRFQKRGFPSARWSFIRSSTVPQLKKKKNPSHHFRNLWCTALFLGSAHSPVDFENSKTDKKGAMCGGKNNARMMWQEIALSLWHGTLDR